MLKLKVTVFNGGSLPISGPAESLQDAARFIFANAQFDDSIFVVIDETTGSVFKTGTFDDLMNDKW